MKQIHLAINEEKIIFSNRHLNAIIFKSTFKLICQATYNGTNNILARHNRTKKTEKCLCFFRKCDKENFIKITPLNNVFSFSM